MATPHGLQGRAAPRRRRRVTTAPTPRPDPSYAPAAPRWAPVDDKKTAFLDLGLLRDALRGPELLEYTGAEAHKGLLLRGDLRPQRDLFKDFLSRPQNGETAQDCEEFSKEVMFGT